MSMSIALRWWASMTFWYAPAKAEALEHFSPSFLPAQPPNDTTTSPPPARIFPMAVASTPLVSERSPSHFGLQPPSERMNATVNQRIPVLAITSAGSCGLPQPKYSYGAAPMKVFAAAFTCALAGAVVRTTVAVIPAATPTAVAVPVRTTRNRRRRTDMRSPWHIHRQRSLDVVVKLCAE